MTITFETIGEYHLPNRIKVAAGSKLVLADFIKFMPLRCAACKKRKRANELAIYENLSLFCVDRRNCVHPAAKPKPSKPLRDAETASDEPTPAKKRSRALESPTGASRGTTKPKRCREVNPDEPDNGDYRCRGPEGHSGRHKDKYGNRW